MTHAVFPAKPPAHYQKDSGPCIGIVFCTTTYYLFESIDGLRSLSEFKRLNSAYNGKSENNRIGFWNRKLWFMRLIERCHLTPMDEIQGYFWSQALLFLNANVPSGTCVITWALVSESKVGQTSNVPLWTGLRAQVMSRSSGPESAQSVARLERSQNYLKKDMHRIKNGTTTFYHFYLYLYLYLFRSNGWQRPGVRRLRRLESCT